MIMLGNFSRCRWIVLSAILNLAAVRCQSWGRFWETPTVAQKISVYVAGTQRLSGTNSNWWIKKYDENGIEDTANWNKTFGGGTSFDDSPNAIAVDSGGNVYVVGYQSITTPNRNWWLKKFSADGVEDTANWNKTFDGGGNNNEEAFAVTVDGQDNVFVAGSRYNPGTTSTDWWLKKYSSSGVEDTVNWDKTINLQSGSTDEAFAVRVASDGSVYIAGAIIASTTFTDFTIKKFSSTGVEIVAGWPIVINGFDPSNDGVYALTLDSAGNAYSGGLLRNNVTFEDFALRRHSASGVIDPAWTKNVDAGANQSGEKIRALVLDSAGNLYAGGKLIQAGPNDIWTIKKYDPSGSEVLTGWNKSFNADAGNLLDEVYGLAVDSKNNVYAAGACARAATSTDWCIKKYDSAGVEDTVNWNKIFDGGFSLSENATAIAVVGP